MTFKDIQYLLCTYCTVYQAVNKPASPVCMNIPGSLIIVKRSMVCAHFPSCLVIHGKDITIRCLYVLLPFKTAGQLDWLIDLYLKRLNPYCSITDSIQYLSIFFCLLFVFTSNFVFYQRVILACIR